MQVNALDDNSSQVFEEIFLNVSDPINLTKINLDTVHATMDSVNGMTGTNSENSMK